MCMRVSVSRGVFSREAGVVLRASEADLVAYAALRGTPGPDALESVWEFGKWAFGCGRGVRLRAFLVVWLLEFGL